MDVAAQVQRVGSFVRQLQALVRWGKGDPTGVVRAPLGAIYLNLNGGAAVTLWVKQSEVAAGDATGWVAK